ncbi:MAG TPA: MFS transporter, partial [Pseudonocardia sp.]|nr:MFS transporter [Pseudonocardia sp.]
LYLRLKLEDTPVFRELAEHGEAEAEASGAFKDVFREYWPVMLKLAGLVIALNVANYTLLAYLPTYLQGTINMSSGDTDLLVVVGQVAMLVFIPLAGGLSDRVGRKPLWWFSLVGLFVLAIPMFLLMSQGLGWAIVAFTVLGLVYVAQLATISATFPAMFPTHVRFTGFAITYNVATAAFGGTAPFVNEWLIGSTGDNLIPAYYMMAACAVGMIALARVPETAGASIRGRGIPTREPVSAAPR